jgi:peptidoglycan/LPS O-acetylase OafA/YrhL
LSNRLLIITCGLIIIASPLSRLISFYIAQRHGWVSYKIFDYTWNSADGLACGAVLAVIIREFSPSRLALRRAVIAILILAMAIFLAALPLGLLSRHAAAGAALQVVPAHLAFVALLIAALLLGSGHHRYWSRSPILEFFGRISYGLYLYHLMLFSGFEWLLNHGYMKRLDIDPFWGLMIRFLVVGSLSVATAYLSRRYFEDPFLRLKNRWPDATSAIPTHLSHTQSSPANPAHASGTNY